MSDESDNGRSDESNDGDNDNDSVGELSESVEKVTYMQKLSEILEYNESRKAREFEIELNPDIGAAEILKCLAHEMTHIKQYAYNETNETLTRWKGLRIDSDTIDYWDQPWEVEAFGMETGLFSKFAVKEKLWEVFDNIANPDGAIEPEGLGWK